MASSTTTDIDQVARWFHALSDGTRVEILHLLSRGERCVCDLMEETSAAQSRLSFHLKVLKTAGLVIDRREGRWSYYSIVPGTLDQMKDVLAELRSGATAATAAGRCCD